MRSSFLRWAISHVRNSTGWMHENNYKTSMFIRACDMFAVLTGWLSGPHSRSKVLKMNDIGTVFGPPSNVMLRWVVGNRSCGPLNGGNLLVSTTKLLFCGTKRSLIRPCHVVFEDGMPLCRLGPSRMFTAPSNASAGAITSVISMAHPTSAKKLITHVFG